MRISCMLAKLSFFLPQQMSEEIAPENMDSSQMEVVPGQGYNQQDGQQEQASGNDGAIGRHDDR